MNVVEKFVNRSGILEAENIVQQMFYEIKEELTIDPELGRTDVKGEDVEALFGADVAKCVQGEDVNEDDLQLV